MPPPITPDKILDYIRSCPAPAQKRDIARAFNIKGSGARVELKKTLKALRDEGSIMRVEGGGYTIPEGLPAVLMLEVTGTNEDGDLIARPLIEQTRGKKTPPIFICPDKKGGNLAVGQKALCRLKRQENPNKNDKTEPYIYEARVIKALSTQSESADNATLIGQIRIDEDGRATLHPADKKARYDYDVPPHALKDAKDGDIVAAHPLPARGLRNKIAQVVEVLGKKGDINTISLISMHEAGISNAWPEAAIKQTEKMSVPALGKREDLRSIPLITIDGADARDFDDAVFAQKLDNGTYHLIVAIADVSHYVTADTALDRESQKRGNSTYFPDRVVPMLPEALSNDLCSLRPNEDRACLAVHMYVDEHGSLDKFKFVRGLMRSHARMTYEQVQAIRDGVPLPKSSIPLDISELKAILSPLYDAFETLNKAREQRGALDLDLPEQKILVNDDNVMTGVTKRERLDSHKLIEEFMVLANVAAASALEKKKAPCVYRVHEPPPLDKLDSAHEFLESFGLNLPKGMSPKPKQLNHLLNKAEGKPYAHLVNEMILRSQSQAVYSTENKGHYGLALTKYAHFTSPIRRYADLLVHRSLVEAYGLGSGGLSDEERVRLDEICAHISATERTSMQAERNAVQRFTAAYLSEKIGAVFNGRITGVTRFGLFVMLDDTGADGFVPARTLPGRERYIHDEKAHALIAPRSRILYRLGAAVRVHLEEANPLTGSTLLSLEGHEKGADIEGVDLPKPTNLRGQNKTNNKSYKRSAGKNAKRTKPKHRRKR